MKKVHKKPLNFLAPAQDARLLRGVFRMRNPDGTSSPDDVDCHDNWQKLLRSGLQFDGEDQAIIEYLHAWPWENVTYRGGDVQVATSAPDYTTIKDYFESSDKIEVVDRMSEVSKAAVVIRSNYGSVIRSAKEERALRSFERLTRESANIARHGMDLGRGFRRGLDEAESHLEDGLRAISESGTEDRFEFTDAGDWLDGDDEPVRCVLPHFSFCEGRPNAIVAWAGLSKTFLMYELGIAVAAGLKSAWGGVEIGLHGKVRILDYEMGGKIARRRVRRLAFGLGVSSKALQGRLSLATLPRTRLSSPGMEADLVRLCEGHALCMIDSFRAATSGCGTDENSSEMADYVNLLMRVSEQTQCVIVIIHHERKSSKDDGTTDATQKMRGTSALVGAIGASVHVLRRSDGSTAIVQGKVSHGRGGETVTYRLEDCGERVEKHKDYQGIRIVPYASAAVANEKETVFELLRSNGEGTLTRDLIMDELKSRDKGMKTARLSGILQELVAEGRLVHEKKGGFRVVETGDLL